MKKWVEPLRRALGPISPSTVTFGSRLLSILAGVGAAIVLHYVLYRIGLPLEPFIYVSF